MSTLSFDLQDQHQITHLIFNDFRAGKNTLISCFSEYPDVYLKFLKLFKILTNIDTLLTKPGEKTSQERETTAKACEEFGIFFPVNFYRSLTRKMHVLSFVAPQQIRNDGDFFKFLKLEQEIERAHHILNILERRFEPVKNKALKYFLMIKAFKNLQKCDFSITLTDTQLEQMSDNQIKELLKIE